MAIHHILDSFNQKEEEKKVVNYVEYKRFFSSINIRFNS